MYIDKINEIMWLHKNSDERDASMTGKPYPFKVDIKRRGVSWKVLELSNEGYYSWLCIDKAVGNIGQAYFLNNDMHEIVESGFSLPGTYQCHDGDPHYLYKNISNLSIYLYTQLIRSVALQAPFFERELAMRLNTSSQQKTLPVDRQRG